MSMFLTYEDRLVIAQLLQENVSFGVIGNKLGNPDCYLRMKRMKQLYMELYITENIEKFRSIIIPIEKNAAG